MVSGLSQDFGFKLSFRRLRVSAWPRIARADVSDLKSTWLPSACSNFSNRGGIGHCNALDAVCSVWSCEANEVCGEFCAKSCVVFERDIEVVRRPPEPMVGALADLQELRAEFCRTTSPNDVVSGLLSLAAVWTSLGIAGHLSEILSTIRIHQWLFEQYGDLRLFSIPSGKPTVSPAVLQIWQTILADWDLSESIEKLKLGDAVLVLTA